MRNKPKECPFCKEIALKCDSVEIPCRRWMKEDDIYTSEVHEHCRSYNTALVTIKSDSDIKFNRITNGIQVIYKTKKEKENG